MGQLGYPKAGSPSLPLGLPLSVRTSMPTRTAKVHLTLSGSQRRDAPPSQQRVCCHLIRMESDHRAPELIEVAEVETVPEVNPLVILNT